MTELIFVKDGAGRLTYANAATLWVIGMIVDQAIGSLNKDNFRDSVEHVAIAG